MENKLNLVSNFNDRFKEAFGSRGVTEFAEEIGLSKQTISAYLNGTRKPKRPTAEVLAKKLNVSPIWLLGYDVPKEHKAVFQKDKSNVSDIMTDNIFMIPLFENVSAGFGSYADSMVIDYVPIYIESGVSAKEYIAIRVKGDSMYPKIEDGDIVVVHKQDEIDSGDIGVVLIDGDDAYVKKIEYDKNSITLVSLNPEYKDKIYEGDDVYRIKVVGKVWKIIKEL